MKANVFFLLLITVISSFAVPKVSYFPVVEVSIGSKFQVGVQKVGKKTINYIDSTSFSYGYINNNSRSFKLDNSHVWNQSSANNYTLKKVSKEPPSLGGFLTSIAKGISTGDISSFLGSLAGGIDYATSPYKTSWESVYEQKQFRSEAMSSNMQSNNNSSNFNQAFKTIQNILKDSVSVDYNAGFVSLTIRLVNKSKRSLYIGCPVIALFFESNNGDYIHVATKKTFLDENKPNTLYFLAANGGKLDLQWRADSLDFAKLIIDNSFAKSIAIRMQELNVAESDDQKPMPLERMVEMKETESISLFIKSDSYNINCFISPEDPKAGLSIKEIIQAIDLQPTFFDSSSSANLSLNIAEIEPDSNSSSEKDLLYLKGDELRRWRKWVAVVKNEQGGIVKYPKMGTNLKPRSAVLLYQLNGKQVLGSKYSPVVYSRPNYLIRNNSITKLVDFPLQQGDRIILKNVKIEGIYSPKIWYNTQRSTFPYRLEKYQNRMFSLPSPVNTPTFPFDSFAVYANGTENVRIYIPFKITQEKVCDFSKYLNITIPSSYTALLGMGENDGNLFASAVVFSMIIFEKIKTIGDISISSWTESDQFSEMDPLCLSYEATVLNIATKKNNPLLVHFNLVNDTFPSFALAETNNSKENDTVSYISPFLDGERWSFKMDGNNLQALSKNFDYVRCNTSGYFDPTDKRNQIQKGFGDQIFGKHYIITSPLDQRYILDAPFLSKDQIDQFRPVYKQIGGFDTTTNSEIIGCGTIEMKADVLVIRD